MKQVTVIPQYPSFQSSYESERGTLNVMKAVGSVRNSVKNVTNAVTSVPVNIFHTVDSVVDNIAKALQVQTYTALAI
jgi:hypothetical protein